MYAIQPSAFLSGFRDLERLVDEMHQAFGHPSYRGAAATPAFNAWGDEQRLVLTAEVPGVDPAALGVNVLGDTLTVSGTADGREFSRSLQLPYRIDSERTEAQCKDGVLTVTLHRPEADKPRAIAVAGA
jgi:HSP20 family protein